MNQLNNQLKNQQGGFLQLIIFIIVAVFLMQYFGLTISGIVDWFKSVL